MAIGHGDIKALSYPRYPRFFRTLKNKFFLFCEFAIAICITPCGGREKINSQILDKSEED
jgi:hypothetical protein